MKKVSVIVPAYNAHDTLGRCLTSLVNQTLEDIEIIVVNDASKDDTLEIMRRCEALYPGKVIAVDGKTNRGGGGARNQALDIASGEYIGFVDSDDYIASNMYEALYSKAKECDADIVDCGMYQEAIDKNVLLINDTMTGEITDEKRRELILGGGYLCSKIYRRILFEDPKVRFRENIPALNDNDIIRYMFFRAKNVFTVKEVFYWYSNTPASATKTKNLDAYYNSLYSAMEGVYGLCHVCPEYKDLSKQAIQSVLAKWYLYCINRCLYDRIARLGASVDNVPLYFENNDEKINGMLKKLTELRKEILDEDYHDNPDLTGSISEIDLKIMEECDKSFFRYCDGENGL